MSQNPQKRPNRREVVERMSDEWTRKLLTDAGEEWSRENSCVALAKIEPVYTLPKPWAPQVPLEKAIEYWAALARLQKRVDEQMTAMQADGFDGHVDVRLFALDGQTLHASIVVVEEGASLPNGDGTARWKIDHRQQRRVA